MPKQAKSIERGSEHEDNNGKVLNISANWPEAACHSLLECGMLTGDDSDPRTWDDVGR